MKKLFIFATAFAALVSCSSDEFIGDAAGSDNSQTTNGAIAFSTGLSSSTRADHVGADAANLLNKHFTVGGFKGASSPATTTVFDNYVVSWTENTAAKTESNTSDWEYVGTAAVVPSTLAGNTQTIKYWDYSQDLYDFVAYSTGTNAAVTETPTTNQIKVTAFSTTDHSFSLQGAEADLNECYIADRVTVKKANFGEEVRLSFRNLSSKVRVALYETIPGYSVKDVKFYQNDSDPITTDISSNSTATLIGTFYTGGKYTVTYPGTTEGESDYNKAHVAYAAEGDYTNGTSRNFGSINYTAAQSHEAAGSIYLGRSSTTASFAGTGTYYTNVLPNETGQNLELRVNYTLVSIDGSGETITIHGAKAFIPAIYAQWKPNYAYTYIFKISDNTNGWTSTVTSDPAGLYPITFDAVVLDSEEATQSTITTVATPSITTYQKGHDITKDEYLASTGDIYIQVMNNGTLVNDLNHKTGEKYDKSFLYTLSAAKTEAEVMDALNIRVSESAGTITGRNGLTLTPVEFDPTITTVPGADGNNINVIAGTAAKFTPAANTTYAYVYDTGTDNADTEYHTAVVLSSQPDDWPSTYFTDEACTTAATSTFTSGTYYQKYTNLNKVYGVKVIKVVAGS